MAQPLHYDHRDLFDRYYRVSYRHFDSRSPDHIRRYGVRVSGVPSIDSTIEKYEVESELTIDSMFEMWRKGVTIKVRNYLDSAEIYEIIQRHLVTTAEFLRGSINGSNRELLKDMMDLDKFAAVVYDKAKTIFTDQERAAVDKSNFAGLQTINFFNILNKNYSRIEEVTVKKDGTEVIKKAVTNTRQAPVREREDLSSVFIDQIERLGGIGGIRGEQK